MSHRGESSLGSIFIHLRFVAFLAAEMTLISRSRAAETPTLKPKPFILIKAGRRMEGGRVSPGRAAEDGGAATDQKRRSSEAFAPFSRACSSTFKANFMLPTGIPF